MAEPDSPWSEQDWLSTDWLKTRCCIVDCLDEQGGVPIRERKWRLFLVACLRRVWHVFKDERCLRLVDAVEQRADGVITQEQLDQLWLEAGEPPCEDNGDPDDCPPDRRAAACAAQALGNAANATVQSFEGYCGGGWAADAADDLEVEKQFQIDLVGEIFGNPFRPVTLNMSWQTPTVVALAHATYENYLLPDRTLDPTRLAVLADALEEAGCTDADVLGHIRSAGAHVRGCWVVDLLLGKG